MRQGFRRRPEARGVTGMRRGGRREPNHSGGSFRARRLDVRPGRRASVAPASSLVVGPLDSIGLAPTLTELSFRRVRRCRVEHAPQQGRVDEDLRQRFGDAHAQAALRVARSKAFAIALRDAGWRYVAPLQGKPMRPRAHWR
jgi:hypothetical protein